MTAIGYAISSEEHAPLDILRHARMAEDVGFPFSLISDHFHPWVPKQGHSPFVWGVLGGLAHATQRMEFGTGVTCPIMRIHPAIIAQAAATAGAMLPGRFFLGVGAGERLNEHILGDHWPEPDVRQEMLEESVELIRALWKGKTMSHRGEYFVVENARIYTLPEQLPPIMLAASGPEAAELAGQIGDGFISTAPKKELVQKFESSGGRRKPKYGQMTVCWAPDEAQAKKTALEWWPNGGLGSPLNTELALPEHFEQAAKMVTEEDVAKEVICGPDPQPFLEMIQKYVEAGFDHVYLHQVGPDQEGFIQFAQRQILPKFQSGSVAGSASGTKGRGRRAA